MGNFICKICYKEFETLFGLSKHISQKHNMCAEETYIEHVLNGVIPKCKCGCGNSTNFLSIKKGFTEFIRGHSSKINNNWGHNKKALDKSHNTQKQMYESGELEIWNKGLNKDNDNRIKNYGEKISLNFERGDKISKSLSGKEKSEEHKKNLSIVAKKRWEDPKEREKQRYNRLNYFRSSLSKNRSKLEIFFETLLDNMDIEFESPYNLNGFLYDFYIKKHNILIEVDGDWYHFNQEKYSLPLSPIQENTLNNDKKKNKIAKDNNIKLIRF